MPTKAAEDPAVVAALQAKAARSPRVYRFWLALIAIAGDFALTLTLVFPIAATIVIGVVLYPPLFWIGIAGIVFFVWLFRPTFRFHGRELIEPAPRLEEELAALKRKLGVPGRMRVYLDDSFNAAAMQTRGYFGIVGTRCGLILGVPLLLAVSREQLLAVIAHEFGHFSRRHGLLGQWLYRARVGWMEYAKQVRASDSLFDVATAWYAEQFVPYFSKRTFVESRQCEYEADADAMLAVGTQAFAQAMTRIAVVGRYWEKEMPKQVRAWQLESQEPPADFLMRFDRGIGACASAQLESWLNDEMRAPSTWIDTHPSLSERLHAANQQPMLVAPSAIAGETLLGEHWPKVLAEFNDKWRKDMRPGWLAQHLRLKHIVQPLLAADAGGMPEQRLARALALREADAAAGLANLCALQQANPEHKRIRFAYAAALLEENDEEGVGVMHILAREDPAFRLRAFQRVLAYYERKGNTRQIQRWSAWLKQLSPQVGQAKAAFVTEAERGAARASSLAAGERAVISEAARLDRAVAGAWLLEGQAKLTYAEGRGSLPVGAQLLTLAVDTEQARASDQDEESIARRYEGLLRTLVPPDQLTVARTYFTTEGRPDLYAPNSEFALFATDDSRLKAAVGFEKCDWQ
jgi:Zn-dependent protease with chaperone function